MDPDSWLSLIAILICVALSAFFSGAETTLSSLNKYKYKVKAEEGNTLAKLIVWLCEHFERTLIGILIGNNVVNIGLSTVSAVFAFRWFSVYLDDDLLSWITSIVMTIVVYILGESIPKIIAKKNPDRFAKFSAYPLAFFVFLFYPFELLFEGINWLVKRLAGADHMPTITEEDFTNVVEEIEKKGDLEDNESDIIQASLEFADTSVKEVLTPVRRMFMIDLKGLTKEALLDIIRNTKYSRIPVYYGEKDRVIGILIVKNYLNAYFKDHNVSVLSTLQKPYIVSPRIMIDDLVEGFRSQMTQVALVMKDKKLIGMVTTEDVLEELVGKINETAKLEAAEGKQ